MKKTITFTVTLDTKTARIIGLEMMKGAYSRTEFITEDVDVPASIKEATDLIGSELRNTLNRD